MIDHADAEDRITGLDDFDATETLVALVPANETDQREFWLAFTDKPHPDHDTDRILKERYVQLSDSDDWQDTFMRNGINRRYEPGDADLPRNIAKVMASISAQIDADTLGDRAPLRPAEE